MSAERKLFSSHLFREVLTGIKEVFLFIVQPTIFESLFVGLMTYNTSILNTKANFCRCRHLSPYMGRNKIALEKSRNFQVIFRRYDVIVNGEFHLYDLFVRETDKKIKLLQTVNMKSIVF
jgi:hypothetical protein